MSRADWFTDYCLFLSIIVSHQSWQITLRALTKLCSPYSYLSYYHSLVPRMGYFVTWVYVLQIKTG